jgi:hypothetical protein
VQPVAGITLDCVRMTMYKFALSATNFSPEERRLAKLAPELQPAAVRAKLGTRQFFEAVLAQEHAPLMLKVQEEQETRSQIRDSNGRDLHIGPRAFIHRYKAPRSKW